MNKSEKMLMCLLTEWKAIDLLFGNGFSNVSYIYWGLLEKIHWQPLEIWIPEPDVEAKEWEVTDFNLWA